MAEHLGSMVEHLKPLSTQPKCPAGHPTLHTVTELLHWCQQKLGINMTGHPVFDHLGLIVAAMLLC